MHAGRKNDTGTRSELSIDLASLLGVLVGSVNAANNDWRHRWLVYFEKQRTAGGIFLYDTTVVGPLPILLFGGTTKGADSPLLRFDSKGNEWGAGDNDESRKNSRGENVSSPPTSTVVSGDTTVQLVHDIVKAQPGAVFGLSRLSGFLKRNFYAHRDKMGPIRRWMDEHDDIFRVSKEEGRWVVKLVTSNTHAVVEAPQTSWTPTFFGVQDWIYFEGDPTTADLVERCKRALDLVLQRRVKTSTAGEWSMKDPACTYGFLCMKYLITRQYNEGDILLYYLCVWLKRIRGWMKRSCSS